MVKLRLESHTSHPPYPFFPYKKKKKKTYFHILEWYKARLVHVFKNWKLLFENICENMCGWKSALKCVKCCLKTQTKHFHRFLKTTKGPIFRIKKTKLNGIIVNNSKIVGSHKLTCLNQVTKQSYLYNLCKSHI